MDNSDPSQVKSEMIAFDKIEGGDNNSKLALSADAPHGTDSVESSMSHIAISHAIATNSPANDSKNLLDPDLHRQTQGSIAEVDQQSASQPQLRSTSGTISTFPANLEPSPSQDVSKNEQESECITARGQKKKLPAADPTVKKMFTSKGKD